MRGLDDRQTARSSIVLIEDPIPADHPLRVMLPLMTPAIAVPNDVLYDRVVFRTLWIDEFIRFQQSPILPDVIDFWLRT
jgi:hypothetical protein